MAKTKIEFEYDGKAYCLEYTAETIKKLEKSGFSFGRLEDHILTSTEELFYGAFLANHKDVSRKIRERIYAEFSAEEDGTSDKLSEVLFEMVNEAINSLTPSGNLKWKRTD